MLFSLFLPTGPDGNPVAGTSGAVNVVTVPVSVAASNGGTPPQVGLINRKKYEKYEKYEKYVAYSRVLSSFFLALGDRCEECCPSAAGCSLGPSPGCPRDPSHQAGDRADDSRRGSNAPPDRQQQQRRHGRIKPQ